MKKVLFFPRIKNFKYQIDGDTAKFSFDKVENFKNLNYKVNIREKETNIVVDTSLFSFDIPVGDLKKGNLIEIVARQGPSLNKGSSILRFK